MHLLFKTPDKSNQQMLKHMPVDAPYFAYEFFKSVTNLLVAQIYFISMRSDRNVCKFWGAKIWKRPFSGDNRMHRKTGLTKKNFKQKSKTVFLTIALASILFPPFTAFTQTSRGAVSGLVMDSAGKFLDRCAIDLININTGDIRTTSTNAAGIYRFEAVDPGMYKVKISKHSYKMISYRIFPVETNQTATINAVLESGAEESAAEIKPAADTKLNKESPVLGGTLPGIALVRLPYAFVDPYYAPAFPGVLVPWGNTNFGNSIDFSTNGQRPRANNYRNYLAGWQVLSSDQVEMNPI
jgi:hypothetical protein